MNLLLVLRRVSQKGWQSLTYPILEISYVYWGHKIFSHSYRKSHKRVSRHLNVSIIEKRIMRHVNFVVFVRANCFVRESQIQNHMGMAECMFELHKPYQYIVIDRFEIKTRCCNSWNFMSKSFGILVLKSGTIQKDSGEGHFRYLLRGNIEGAALQ